MFICRILAHKLIEGCRKHGLLSITNVIDIIKNSKLWLFYLMQYQLFSMLVKIVNKYLYNCACKYKKIKTCEQLALVYSLCPEFMYICTYLIWQDRMPSCSAR